MEATTEDLVTHSIDVSGYSDPLHPNPRFGNKVPHCIRTIDAKPGRTFALVQPQGSSQRWIYSFSRGPNNWANLREDESLGRLLCTTSQQAVTACKCTTVAEYLECQLNLGDNFTIVPVMDNGRHVAYAIAEAP